MLVTLDEVKAYVKLEVTDEDLEDPEIAREVEILSQFLDTALHYLKNATKKEFVSNPLAKQYVLIYVAELFDDHRGLPQKNPTSTKNLLLEQLRYDDEL